MSAKSAQRTGTVEVVTPEEARERGLVCCPNPYCWNGKIDGQLCGVCMGEGVDPVFWRVDWCCRDCHRYPCVCEVADA